MNIFERCTGNLKILHSVGVRIARSTGLTVMAVSILPYGSNNRSEDFPRRLKIPYKLFMLEKWINK